MNEAIPIAQEKPLCECHGEPMFWNKDSRKKAGGYWRCNEKRNAWARAYAKQKRASDSEWVARKSARDMAWYNKKYATDPEWRDRRNTTRRAWQMEKYDTDPVWRISLLLAKARRKRLATLNKMRERLEAEPTVKEIMDGSV